MLFSEFCESPPMHWTSSTIYTVLCLFVVASMIESDPHMIESDPHMILIIVIG